MKKLILSMILAVQNNKLLPSDRIFRFNCSVKNYNYFIIISLLLLNEYEKELKEKLFLPHNAAREPNVFLHNSR